MSKSPIDIIEQPSTLLGPPELSKEELRDLFSKDPFKPGKQYVHDCEECVYLGTADLPPSGGEDGGICDFYYCDKATYRTFIARFGNEGHEYVSYPEMVLRTMRPLTKDIAVLLIEQQLLEAKVSSKKFKLCLWVDPDAPNGIHISVSALTSARYQETLAALLSHVWENFAHDAMTATKLDEILCYIEQALSAWCEDPSSYFPRC